MRPAGASVAIVGGGIVGASVAWHLASRGWRDIVLLDRGDGPGRGSTGAATGGFRAQFSTAIEVRLSLLAREKIQRFRDEVGGDPGYVPAGYLWLATTEAERDALRAALEVQHAAGLTEAVLLTPAGVGNANPALRLDAVVGGAFCPSDGFLRPLGLLEGYLAAAQRLGVRVEWETEVLGFEREAGDEGCIRKLRTSRGDLATDRVVDAAGPWAAQVAAMAGVDLPVTPLRRQVAVTSSFDKLPETMPMTIASGNGFHLRVREGRVLLLRPSPGVPGRPFDTRVDPDWTESVLAEGRRWVPMLEEARLDPGACRAGLYEMSPDGLPILGAAPGCPNLYLANGCSGHGVMHAPALGQLLAEIVSNGRAQALDTSALQPSRFSGQRTPSGHSLL